MKVFICVKRVVDAYVKVRLKSDGLGIETQGVKMSMNPFDEIALEEAIRHKEKGIIKEIVAISIGPKEVQETLRHALSLGADRAIHIETNAKLEPLQIAKLLKVLVEQHQPRLIFLGKQSIDGDNNQTGQMLSALLNWSQATFASKVVLTINDAEVTREVDGGLETIQVKLPAIITTDLRLNEPRYATLPNIMKAKQKPLQVVDASTLHVDLSSTLEIINYQEPSARKPGVKVATVDELINKLKHEAQVI